MNKTKSVQPTPDMEAFREDWLKLLDKHVGHLDSAEMVALGAYSIGQMMALMDARKWTPDMVMEMISKNIEAGNAQALADAGTFAGRA